MMRERSNRGGIMCGLSETNDTHTIDDTHTDSVAVISLQAAEYYKQLMNLLSFF
jgi:hypothetical protein